MGLDARLTDAVIQAVADAGQSEALARRLVAWLEAITSGNEDLADSAAADRHLEFIYGEVKVAEESADQDDDCLDQEDDN